MPIAIDAIGGDYHPLHPVSGSVKAVREHETKRVLVGRQNLINQELEQYRCDAQKVEIALATALRKKRQSFMCACFDLVRKADGNRIARVAHSSAMPVGGHFVQKIIVGIVGSCIRNLLPLTNRKALLVDAAAKIDCSPGKLFQCFLLNSSYTKSSDSIKSSKIGLLNNGDEVGKRDETGRASHELLWEESDSDSRFGLRRHATAC